jgi:hypothetical protein
VAVPSEWPADDSVRYSVDVGYLADVAPHSPADAESDSPADDLQAAMAVSAAVPATSEADDSASAVPQRQPQLLRRALPR